ncbi:PstS family phosphate ABC transporter substrate-binding protein [Flavobacterium caeni]|uniref:Phosphate transport system substrate-binding protein n=1 Tax=Flavobacterium caeni TaxID=490189 RepID=A0A1G5JVN4_9FLAO|nr:substrate-binding domain-containing protein [Flavobacterium caeni]SCY91828.1 phosphate transport system substrate-binding protein [Flavobacterium caeni]
MKFISRIFPFVLLALFIITCNQKRDGEKETILEGNMTLLVDESLLPIVEEQVEVFESQYNAKITLEPKSEAEVIQILANDSARVAVLARNLTKDELNVFKSKKISPRITKFATDGIALIANKNLQDTIVSLEQVLDVLRQKPVSGIKGLVFDNPNSSTAQYMNQLAGIKSFPATGVFSFKTNEETIKYVSENEGMIGVVGVNWVYNPREAIRPFVEKIHILSVADPSGNTSFPSQNDIAEGKYPLARDLFIVNCQGFSGLGMGFASFIAGETGQRIVLKSGLVPAKTPGRKILIRQDIEKK